MVLRLKTNLWTDMDAHDIIFRYSSAKGFDLYEATQIQDLFNNHGSLLGPNANNDQVSNYLKSFYDGMKGRNIRLAEAGTSLVLESLAYASNEAVTSARVESRFTDWEVRTNVEVQMLQSLGIAPIRRQVPFPRQSKIEDRNQAEMELALRIYSGSNVGVSFDLFDTDPDERFLMFYRMLGRTAATSGEILRPTTNLVMPDWYIQTGKNAFSLYGESNIGPISLGILMTKEASSPAESINKFFPDKPFGFRLYNELPDADGNWIPVVKELQSYDKANSQSIWFTFSLIKLGPYYKIGIMGETSKFSPISPQRIRSSAITSDGYQLKINFHPFKEDNFQFYIYKGDTSEVVNIGKSCEAEPEIKMLTISYNKEGQFNYTCSEFGFSECSKGPCPIPCSEDCPTGACTQADPCDSRKRFLFDDRNSDKPLVDVFKVGCTLL